MSAKVSVLKLPCVCILSFLSVCTVRHLHGKDFSLVGCAKLSSQPKQKCLVLLADALRCMHKAIGYYTDLGRLGMAARNLRVRDQQHLPALPWSLNTASNTHKALETNRAIECVCCTDASCNSTLGSFLAGYQVVNSPLSAAARRCESASSCCCSCMHCQ